MRNDLLFEKPYFLWEKWMLWYFKYNTLFFKKPFLRNYIFCNNTVFKQTHIHTHTNKKKHKKKHMRSAEMPTVPLSRAYISLISLMMIRDAASMKAEVISDARCGYVLKFLSILLTNYHHITLLGLRHGVYLWPPCSPRPLALDILWSARASSCIDGKLFAQIKDWDKYNRI